MAYRDSNPVSFGPIVFGVLAGFFVLSAVTYNLGRMLTDPQHRGVAATAVKAPAAPAKSVQPASPAVPQTAPKTPTQIAPVTPPPTVPPVKP